MSRLKVFVNGCDVGHNLLPIWTLYWNHVIDVQNWSNSDLDNGNDDLLKTDFANPLYYYIARYIINLSSPLQLTKRRVRSSFSSYESLIRSKEFSPGGKCVRERKRPYHHSNWRRSWWCRCRNNEPSVSERICKGENMKWDIGDAKRTAEKEKQMESSDQILTWEGHFALRLRIAWPKRPEDHATRASHCRSSFWSWGLWKKTRKNSKVMKQTLRKRTLFENVHNGLKLNTTAWQRTLLDTRTDWRKQ